MSSCNCIGPQNGEPLCPCAMRSVEVRDGHYWIPAKDLGPVRSPYSIPKFDWLSITVPPMPESKP